jgi:HSP20 family protein
MKTKPQELTQTTPRRELGLFDDMDRLFDGFLRRGWLRPFRNPWPEWVGFDEGMLEVRTPRVDVIEKEEEILVRAELPGMEREEVHLELAAGVLTIRGEQHREEKVEEGEVLRSEISRSSFSRAIALPQEVDPDHVTANLKDGVLEVRLPKTAKTERKRIEIQG